jgi:hypothetical protein
MLPLNRETPDRLDWKQLSAFGRYFELKCGDNTYAALEFVKKFGSLAEARTLAGAWTFKRRGMMSPAVTARLAGSEQEAAVYRPNWSSTRGELTLAGGEALDFRSGTLWGQDWVLSAPGDVPLLRFATRTLLKRNCEVVVEPAARERADLPLLLSFCWYLLLLYQDDMAQTAVIAS